MGEWENQKQGWKGSGTQISKCHVNHPKEFYTIGNEFILALKVLR